MKILATLIATAIVSGYAMSAQAQSSDCDAVLVQQTDRLKDDYKSSLAWMKLIDESSYGKAKQSANVFSTYFSADYKSFDEKRKSLLQRESFNEDITTAREIWKSSLSSSQISAWSDCMGNKTQLFVYYKDVSPDSATVVVRWAAPNGYGPIRMNEAEVSSGLLPKKPFKKREKFSGERNFVVSRTSPNQDIRGYLNGNAGFDGSMSYQASFFVAGIKPVEPEIPEPDKIVVDLAGRQQKSIGYWGSGKYSTEFNCMPATPSNMTALVIRTSARNAGKTRTCGVPKPYCDGHREGCVEYTIAEGCYVSDRWLAWYKARLEKYGLPYTDQAACAPKAQPVT